MIRMEDNGETIHAESGRDASPAFRGYVNGHSKTDPTRCSWCYVGAHHTLLAHTSALLRFESQSEADKLGQLTPDLFN